MKIWWLTLITTYILCLMSRAAPRPVMTGGTLRYRNNVMWAFFACTILVLVSGLRSGIGDTPAYAQGFQEFDTGLGNIINYLLHSGDKDSGFYAFAMLIKTFISTDPQVYIFLLALLTLTFIFIRLYKTTDMIDMAVFLFITTGCYLVTMNGIRQYFVSALLFLAFPWIKERKWHYYLPLVLLVSTMHGSALIFLPIYFIADKEAWGAATKLILLTGVVLFITYPVSGPVIANLLHESQYSEYGTLVTSTGGGANIFRPIVMAVPVFLSYWGRNMLKGKEKYYNIVVNMSVINLVAILLATRYWIYARFNMYFTLYMIILLIWCVIYLFDDKNRKIVYILCLGLYGCYYWYEMVISLGQIYTSDYIKF